jgi:hypothetical protein
MTEYYGDDYLKYNELVINISKEFPRFKVVPKDESFFMRALYAVTLMTFWNKSFMTNYITAVFGKVYMPRRLIGTAIGYDVLRHELVHLRDARRWPVLFELSYLFFPLPFVFTMRAYWEYRGYCESMIAERDRYGYINKAVIEYYISLFSSSEYLWMFPFPNFLRKKFYAFLERHNTTIK